jgi:outer membrane receptor protein involved in Fe transport
VTGADTRLTGNGLQEMRLLAADRRSVYTFPDTTRNRAWLVNLTGRHAASDAVALSGNAFWRSVRTRTLNGDANDDVLGTAFAAPGEDEFPRLLCLDGDEPDESCSGLLNRSRNRQREWGATVEAAIATPWLTGGTLTLGAAYVDGRARFAQTSQFGFLTEQRGVVGADGAFDDDAEVALSARTRVLSLYALSALKITPRLDLDLSARFDQSWIRNRDAITPGGGPGSLDGDHRFKRLNPAISMRWSATGSMALDAALAQTSRVPSAIELGCADPETPCRLPNALAGDPPLDQVVATTFEAGASWTRSGLRLRAGLFRTTARRDILFVAADQAGFGYFRNFGRTRRQGADLDLTARLGAWRASAHYTFLDATYRSPETVGGAANSANDGPAPGFEGAIQIEPGDRIPLLPRHVFKAGLAWDPASWLTLSADLQASSGVIARGNENNDHAPDGLYTLGPGRTRGYAVVNAGVELRPRRGLTFFAQMNNLLDARYASAAQLGATAFDADGRYVSQPFAGPEIDGERPRLSSTFYAPGAPRSVQIGLRASF